MRILLLNDNPVVRKLVALSAQKTKDDLDVIWSLDEIEHPHYDLLIVDDALYSDEAMSQLKAKVTFKSSLLMATRGAATPAGFDKVINKPFLPTDLVELFSGIAHSLPDVSVDEIEKPIAAMDDLLDDLLADDLEEYNLDDLMEEDAPLKTSVLDSQEVQELQDLLDDDFGDTEEDEFDSAQFETPDIAIIEDLDDGFEEIATKSAEIEDLDELVDFEEPKESLEEELSDDELEAMLLSGNVKSDSPKEDEIDLEALLADVSAEELLDEPLSDDDFEDLEQQIQEAMGNLEPEDLEQPLDDLDFDTLDDDLSDDVLDELDTNMLDLSNEEELKIEDDELEHEDEVLDTLDDDEASAFDDEEMSALEGLAAFENIMELDGLDSLDERDIRLAIGEEIDDELEIRAGDSEHACLDVEALSEAMGKLPALALDELDLIEDEEPVENSSAVGIEALQSLLKALSNDEVAKSLKGLNISININFGNDK